MIDIDKQADRLLEFLRKNRSQKGIMADLRCGFSETTEHKTWAHIAMFCSLESDFFRVITQTIAASYALNPEEGKSGNLGDTLHKIATGGQGHDGLASFEGRFRRLLACQDSIELCRLIPGVIRTAKAKGIPVNYNQLYKDLIYWNSGRVRVRWAEAYWGVKRTES